MSITVELGTEVEERLRTQAAAQGASVQEFVEGLLRQVTSGVPGERPTLAEFDADWAAFAEGLDDIAPLPAEAFSRQAMYGERD